MKSLGKPPFVCLITEGKLTSENYRSEGRRVIEAISAAVYDGVHLVQIRERDLPARLLFELTTDVVAALKVSDTLVLVNDRADIAIAAGADGVHLRESSLRPRVIRDTFPADLVVGVSTHDAQGARSAVAGSADFIFFGPVFDSPGKGAAQGCDELQNVCRAVGKFPVIALGGIDGDNVELVMDAGASGVAGIRSMHDAHDRRRILNAVKASLE